jgi:uncharacterized damage-inducible protein DinB
MSIYLANRLREVLLNGIFIANTNFKAQIENTTFEEATHQIADLNTIALLTFHINYYLQGVNEVFEGRDLTIKDQFSFDMPSLQNENDWTQLKQMFLNQAERFIQHVEQITDDQLNQPFVNEKYGTLQRNIDAMIEHSYYHLGQIVLIRKLIKGNSKIQ